MTLKLQCGFLCFTRIPSGTDGWMEYVPISDKKDVPKVISPKQEGSPSQAYVFW